MVKIFLFFSDFGREYLRVWPKFVSRISWLVSRIAESKEKKEKGRGEMISRAVEKVNSRKKGRGEAGPPFHNRKFTGTGWT
jgi:hypothetical protein